MLPSGEMRIYNAELSKLARAISALAELLWFVFSLPLFYFFYSWKTEHKGSKTLSSTVL